MKPQLVCLLVQTLEDVEGDPQVFCINIVVLQGQVKTSFHLEGYTFIVQLCQSLYSSITKCREQE